MDPRDFLSNNDIQCILVFFENTLVNFDSGPSVSRNVWFENFREHLGFTSLRFSNSKKMHDVSEEIIFPRMKRLNSSVKTWLMTCAIEMITSENDFYLADLRFTATRISKAF